jgi:HEPN domain
MSAADPQAVVQWREALLWLAKADHDISGARTLPVGGQPDLTAFHVQQALEKALKALLLRLRRTCAVLMTSISWQRLPAASGRSAALAIRAGCRQPMVRVDALSLTPCRRPPPKSARR